MAARAVFLDRDGTINEDTGYIKDPDELHLLNGAGEAIKTLNKEGVKVIVITNQSGVARGYFTEEQLHRINERLKQLLRLEGAYVDGIYYCPHHPDDECGCRKPAPSLIFKAVFEHDIDLRNSFIVGDKATDVELARRVGAKAILVLTGEGEEAKKSLLRPDFIAKGIKDAVSWIMQRNKGHT